MLARGLRRPRSTFLLFGPRGTGKSTLLRSWFPDACWFDLLDQAELLRILRDPEYFPSVVRQQPRRKWIVVDEVQKVPALLDEVHRLIESDGYKFALSGSSARKLKCGGANLLAGRAFVLHLAPLTFAEFANYCDLADALRYGALPAVLLDRNRRDRVERLRAYVSTYLAEEIKAEALTRNVAGFARFLTVAALANGQVTNLSNIARDSAVARPTVGTYFSILEDTLIGAFLPAWRSRIRIKEVAHPKFYLFDTGVWRAILDRLPDRPTPEEAGLLLEMYVFHELRAFMHYSGVGGQLSYWRTQDGTEIDFVWTRASRSVAIEVKAAERWKPEFDRGFRTLSDSKIKPHGCYGVYQGQRALAREHCTVFPLQEFLRRLYAGKIIPK